MTEHQQLLVEIERYLAEHRVSPTAFGRQAVNDGRFVHRLRSGKSITLTTLERVREFMQAGKASEAA